MGPLMLGDPSAVPALRLSPMPPSEGSSPLRTERGLIPMGWAALSRARSALVGAWRTFTLGTGPDLKAGWGSGRGPVLTPGAAAGLAGVSVMACASPAAP